MKTVDFSTYAKKIIDLGYDKSNGYRILYKDGEDILATEKDADLRNLSASYIKRCDKKMQPEFAALSRLKNMQAMVISESPYALECIAKKRQITAVLDDMAQIIGYRVKLVPYKNYSLTSALRKSAACLVLPCETYSRGCAISCGRDIYEAYVAMTVLEKNAEVSLKADALGGTKPLEPMNAFLLRRAYLYKYSKEERRSREKK
jgi:ribulose-5-phosphate 4-epimerase/fuculose-1-phosphate aldolase